MTRTVVGKHGTREVIDSFEHLPASMRNRPEVRALTLRVYPNPRGTFQVPGRNAIYDVYPDMISGELICSCPARGRCAHLLAVHNHLQKEQ